MAWLIASVAVGTIAVVGYAGTVTFFVRRRWKRRRAALGLTLAKGEAAEPQDGVAPAEIDFVQIWLDHQWENRFGVVSDARLEHQPLYV